MARARNIKPGFFTNEDLVELDFATRLLFAGLWTVADREGRLQDRPKKIKIDVFPADDVDINCMLQALHERGFVLRYEVDGVKYVQILNWDKHQNPHHTEKASTYPGPNGELTVKPPLKTVKPRKQDGGNLADSLIPDSLIQDTSVTDVTDGAAVIDITAMTKDELWKAGKSLLENAGIPKAQCGSIVGKLAKDYGNEIVVEAVRTAVIERPVDPVSFLTACCQRLRGDRKPVNRQEALEERNRAVGDEWLRQQGVA